MKSERLTLLVTTEDKSAITQRANAMGLSASELVRRAVSAYDPLMESGELQALADSLLTAVDRAEHAVETTLAQLESRSARLDTLRAETRQKTLKAGKAWSPEQTGQAGPVQVS